MSDYAIKVEHISKIYKLYDNPMDRLKESLGFTKKKRYTEYYALDDINFEVGKGETVGIIGTNGAGKSTILKIITGVLSPTSGNVSINGRISALLELGAGFNMEYTGIENVYLNGTMIGFTKDEIDEKLDDIIEFADIGDFINQPVKTYSSGMFVRLAFAVAINIDPEILIVDEALSVGDVFFQSKCYHKFEEFKKMGKTILFVTHDMSSIQKYCDRAILLRHGTKVGEGNPKEMIDLYKKLLVNQLDADENDFENAQSDVDNETVEKELEYDVWKDNIVTNPNVITYGNGMADIIDYASFNGKQVISNVFDLNEEYSVNMKVRFNETVNDPIFAFTIKDIKGTEIAGTNTMYEDIDTGRVEAGETRVISFTQKMMLPKGEYLVSFGCTGYREGEFTVYSRLYDVFTITVTTTKSMVGFFDMNTKISIEM